MAALVAKDTPAAALAVEAVEDLAHRVDGTVTSANHANLVAGKGDGIAKVRGHHEGARRIAQVNGLDIVSANACGAEKLGDRGLCGALYTGVAHVDHLALAAAEPLLTGHERVHACGGSAHGRRQGLLAHKNTRGSGVVGVDKAKGVVRCDKTSLGKRGDNVRGRGGHKQAHVLCRHALRGLPQIQTEQLERNGVRAVERHEVDESHRVALLCGYSFHSFGRSRVRRRSHWRQRLASRSASDSAKGHSYCLKLSRRSAAGAILGSSGAS